MDIREEGGAECISEINITPLVDVSLTLVLIFMMASPFFMKALVPVRLPPAASSQSEDNRNITVSISADGGFAVNESAVDRKSLSAELGGRMKSTGFTFLLIRADERIAHGDVEDVMRIGRGLGFKRIAFATQPKG